MMQALNHMDGLSQMLMAIFFVIMTYRISTRESRPQNVLWWAGTVILVPVVFLATQSSGMGGTSRSGAPAPLPAALNPYMSTFTLLAFGLLAAGFLASAERNRRWTPYFLMYYTAVTLVYAYSAHYGGLQAQVLQNPAFFAALVPTVLLLVFAPIVDMAINKGSFHSLWVPLGAICLLASGYVLWAVALKKVTLEATWQPIVTFTLLFFGLLCLMLGFVLNPRWLGTEQPVATVAKGTSVSA